MNLGYTRVLIQYLVQIKYFTNRTMRRKTFDAKGDRLCF